ncbi:unnamed protein product [Linum tenue]|uniref:Uncharacterized protein n=1 Tax=Linum tenue TaxID=586396 RepID=A0AAV0NJI0_9ROSI|nr:unnamed protein product [Linum tenue]
MEAVKMVMRKALPFFQLTAIIMFMVLIILSSAVPAEATRRLLQRGPTVPSGPNPCSYVPGTGKCIGRHG